jgi:DnaJ-domain-containing protein 1
MVIDSVTITLTRTGDKASLLCQGRPLGVVMKITREELEALATYFAQEARAWRVAHEQNYYRILGLTRAASADEIKKAYRRLARQYHPDGQVGDEDKLKTINAAYAVLSDPTQRTQYDQHGSL